MFIPTLGDLTRFQFDSIAFVSIFRITGSQTSTKGNYRIIPQYHACTCIKKRSQRRKHCALAVVRRRQKFRPPASPFPGAQDGQNLISWRWSLPLPTNPVWWGSMHAISSYRGNRPTNTRRPPPQTGPITLHCAAKLSAQCNDTKWT